VAYYNKSYLILSLLLFGVGLLFYSWYNELIIIRLPFKKIGTPVSHDQSQKKLSTLTFFNGDTFTTEQRELLISENSIKTLNDLITTWLTIQEEEQIIHKKVALHSILLDNTGKEAFISFDRNPLLKDASIYDKYNWIESLLKTIKDNVTSVQTVRFLVQGKPLPDYHLDFNVAWHITGYIKDNQKK
jgi:hypothetical protein